MKNVHTRQIIPNKTQSTTTTTTDRKLDILAAIAAVLTLLAAIIGIYIAWKNLRGHDAPIVI
ncbi:hypothetical protein DCC85_14005 [Paenibacillus sp. CAA11]|uniref:hypothetical protein n=1 Tax=Paenibacillus sp. CAA11 TaxID=1532905 RepID=UPI000D359E96|nr:hypothetical protein [Paenibacillus sp. CAA11]AWB45230.1 hypothetical protein DCC85_14005 [Paenibacillus sp. CAA11]